MQFHIEDINQTTKRINMEIPEDKVSSEIEQAYTKLKNEIRVDGFRKGKVSRSILEKRFKADIETEVASKLITDTFFKAIKDNKLNPLSEPVIDAQPFKAGESFKYSATFEVTPKIEIRGYKGMNLEKEKVAVTDQQMDERIEALRREKAVFNRVSRPLQHGDTGIINFEGFMDGSPFQGGKGESVSLKIGSGTFIPGFEEQMIGMTEGEGRDIRVTFPSEYKDKKFAGRDAVFMVVVNEVKEEVLPAVDDDMAKSLGFDTVDSMRTAVKDILIKETESQVRSQLKRKIMDELIMINQFEVPSSMVGSQLDHMIQDMKTRYEASGINVDEELKKDNMLSNLEKVAQLNIKSVLVITEIAHKEGISVQDLDIEEQLNKISSHNKTEVAAMTDYYKKSGNWENIRGEMLQDKVYDFIIQHSEVVEK